MELFRTRGCLDYVASEPAIPALRVSVRDPITREEDAFTVPVDTGFAGYLLLRREVYVRFATAELPADGFAVYSTMAGHITLRRARATVTVGDKKFESYIETPYMGNGRDLIGRRLLQTVDLALLGEREKICLLEPS